jgi:ABC-type phosphate/phosphonate transport system permease subunit
LIERKLATVVFVALAYSCMQQFIESSTYTWDSNCKNKSVK